MKGIVLCGGSGTRLRPATFSQNKHLLNILNKQMILYPLDTLKSLGIKDILIVTGGEHIGGFAEFLGDGSEYGVTLTYKAQKEAGGIAQALGLAEDFAHGEAVTVILGDNLFFVDNMLMRVGETIESSGGIIWGPPPEDRATLLIKNLKSGASRFGVLKGSTFIDDDHYHIVEKPSDSDSGDVVTGFYIYPNNVFDVIKNVTPSSRGEMEISDVNNHYLQTGQVRICKLNDQDYWGDAGTPESLYRAIQYVAKKDGLSTD